MSRAPVSASDFGEEALDAGAIGKGERADAEGARDVGNESAEGGGIERPDLDRDRGPCPRLDAQQAGLGGRGAGQREEPVVGRGFGGAQEDAAGAGQFGVERQAAEMGADDGDLDAAGRGAQRGSGLGAARLNGAGDAGEEPIGAGGADEGEARAAGRRCACRRAR